MSSSIHCKPSTSSLLTLQYHTTSNLLLTPRDDELNDSLGGTSSSLREQLERAAARASFQPDDTFGDIDAIIAAKRGGGEKSAPPEDHPAGYLSLVPYFTYEP